PPNSKIAAEQIVINPAAGPLILNSDTLKKTVNKPPIIADTTPIAAGNPLAFAMPKLKGNANKNTINPESTSAFKFSFNPGKTVFVLCRKNDLVSIFYFVFLVI